MILSKAMPDGDGLKELVKKATRERRGSVKKDSVKSIKVQVVDASKPSDSGLTESMITDSNDIENSSINKYSK